MRNFKNLVPMAAVLALLTTQQSPADVSISIGFNTFQSSLAPYGSWVTVGSYGSVWHPHVSAGWRPYTDGHWVYSDQGWVWASNESFGWATYHYGRWLEDPNSGWVWVPGAVWAPSWVSWYVTPQYVGWAPLGPSGAPALGPGYCAFVPCASFLSVNIGSVCLPPARNAAFFGSATVINNISINNNTVINGGPSVAQVRKFTGHSVSAVHIVNTNSLSANGAQHNRVQGNSLYAYRPSVQPPANGSTTPLLTNEATHGQVWLGTHNATIRPVALSPHAPGAAAPAHALAPQHGSKGPAAPAHALAPQHGSNGPAAPAHALAPQHSNHGPAAPAHALAPQQGSKGPAAPTHALAPQHSSKGPAAPVHGLAPQQGSRGPAAPAHSLAPNSAPRPPQMAPQGNRPAPAGPAVHSGPPPVPHGQAPQGAPAQPAPQREEPKPEAPR